MDPIAAIRTNIATIVTAIVMAATTCGIVHSITYYSVFGVNYFEFGSRDDFILTALRSPISLLLVLASWVIVYPWGIYPDFKRGLAIFLYAVWPTLIVAILGLGQGYFVREGYGKLIGQPACKLVISYTDSTTEDIFGATPLGSSGQYAVFWIYQLNEIRVISNQATKAIICNIEKAP